MIATRWPFDGCVYSLSAEDLRDCAVATLIADQAEVAERLTAILDTAVAALDALPDFPLFWPTRGFDLETTRSALRDLLPDASAEMVEAAAVELVDEEEW